MGEDREKLLEECLRECSEDLAALIKAAYSGTLQYASELRRYERDMEPVLRARALLEKKS